MNSLYSIRPTTIRRNKEISLSDINKINNILLSTTKRKDSLLIREYSFYNNELAMELEKRLLYLKLKGFMAKIELRKYGSMRIYINGFYNIVEYYAQGFFTLEDIDLLNKTIERVVINYDYIKDYDYFDNHYFLSRQAAERCKNKLEGQTNCLFEVCLINNRRVITDNFVEECIDNINRLLPSLENLSSIKGETL